MIAHRDSIPARLMSVRCGQWSSVRFKDLSNPHSKKRAGLGLLRQLHCAAMQGGRKLVALSRQKLSCSALNIQIPRVLPMHTATAPLSSSVCLPKYPAPSHSPPNPAQREQTHSRWLSPASHPPSHSQAFPVFKSSVPLG